MPRPASSCRNAAVETVWAARMTCRQAGRSRLQSAGGGRTGPCTTGAQELQTRRLVLSMYRRRTDARTPKWGQSEKAGARPLGRADRMVGHPVGTAGVREESSSPPMVECLSTAWHLVFQGPGHQESSRPTQGATAEHQTWSSHDRLRD